MLKTLFAIAAVSMLPVLPVRKLRLRQRIL